MKPINNESQNDGRRAVIGGDVCEACLARYNAANGSDYGYRKLSGEYRSRGNPSHYHFNFVAVAARDSKAEERMFFAEVSDGLSGLTEPVCCILELVSAGATKKGCGFCSDEIYHPTTEVLHGPKPYGRLFLDDFEVELMKMKRHDKVSE